MPPKKAVTTKVAQKITRAKPIKTYNDDNQSNNFDDNKSIDFILENLTINHPKNPHFTLAKEEIFNLTSIKYIHFPNIYVLNNTDLLYEMINYILEEGYEKCLALIEKISNSTSIIDSKIIFKTEIFVNQADKLAETKEKLKTKITINEGIVSCPKCKSKKVMSFGTQTRSGDEGLTYQNTCMNCGWKWLKNS